MAKIRSTKIIFRDLISTKEYCAALASVCRCRGFLSNKFFQNLRDDVALLERQEPQRIKEIFRYLHKR